MKNDDEESELNRDKRLENEESRINDEDDELIKSKTQPTDEEFKLKRQSSNNERLNEEEESLLKLDSSKVENNENKLLENDYIEDENTLHSTLIIIEVYIIIIIIYSFIMKIKRLYQMKVKYTK